MDGVIPMQVSKEQEEEFKKRFNKDKIFDKCEIIEKPEFLITEEQLKDWDKCLQQEIS